MNYGKELLHYTPVQILFDLLCYVQVLNFSDEGTNEFYLFATSGISVLCI